jgi:hypothetical protein
MLSLILFRQITFMAFFGESKEKERFMRIILCMILLFFPFTMKTDATGVSELNYQFYVIPLTGPENTEIELFIKNVGDKPLSFEFPTSQTFEITIKNPAGREVYRYSKGRSFLQAFQTIRINPHNTYKRIVTWNYQVNGKRVPKGEYSVTAFFKPIQLNDQPIKDRGMLIKSNKIFVPDENMTFRHLQVKGSKGNYVITGETSSKGGWFFYTVEDGHIEYINEKQMVVKGSDSDWSTFELQIHIPEEKLPNNSTLILNLYKRNVEGKIIDSYPLVLDKFY